MKVTLINVQISEGNNIVPPLGLLYIAAELERVGHEVQVFDIDPEVHACIDAVVSFDPAMIGLSCYTNTYQKARRLHTELKQVLPGAVYVAGGVHATAQPEQTLSELGCDYLVYAEGERTAVRLVQCIENDDVEGIKSIKGLYYRDGEAIRCNGGPDLIEDLDSLAFPARHLLAYEPYLVPPGMIRGLAKSRVTTIFTSRGCPYPCTYCASSNVQGKRIRRRSPANVVAELTGLVRDYQINGFYICDDLITFDRDWILEFSRQLRESGLDLVWACQSRVDSLDEQMLRAMKSSGCVQIDFGVESGSDKTLVTMRKKAKVADARNAFALTRKLKVRSCATFILGFPGESLDDMEDTFRLAKEIRADYTAFYFLTPYPGTPIYQAAVDNNWIDPKLLEPSEQFTHRQVAAPLMAIEHSPAQLAAVRKRFQNYFFRRNYLRLCNLRFYASLLGVLLLQPFQAVHCVKRYLSVKRLDDLVESVFEVHQRWHRTRALRRSPN